MANLTDDRDLAIRRQFAAFCKTVIHNAAINYLKQEERYQAKAVYMDDLSCKERSGLVIMDQYECELEVFEVCGKKIRVDFQNEKLVSAIRKLTARKKEIILLSMIEQLNDTRIAELLKLDRSTVSKQRRIALVQLKKYMEEA